jgi:N-carbamoyl-L-amino-acid hydrolase
MSRNRQIDAARLWSSLMEMARIGATDNGGVCRLSLSDEDRQSRDLFRAWCEAVGCKVRVDSVGNMFARRPGRDPDLPPVGTGSHLDSQPTGGKFDGAYGVLAGLEVLRTLHEHGVETEAPVEVAVWTNEEGARFAPAMVGSGVFAGVFDLEAALATADSAGKTMGAELERIGYAGDAPLGHAYGAFFEAHIEQGPVLESARRQIGVVTGVQGMRWYDVRIAGDEVHAGPTPMDRRRDPVGGSAEVFARIHALAVERAPHGRATVANIHSSPESRNTVPGTVAFSVDLRHPDAAELAAMDTGLREVVAGTCRARGLEGAVQDVWHSPPVVFDEACVDAVRKGAELMGYDAMDAVSGAGHDAVHVSRLAPTGMVFIPCQDGISHNEAESVTAEDAAAGANVLLHAILERAGA